jgi:general secretion pathway protein B
MSYILEALKKAQAERQLGSSPTLHAPTLQAAEAGGSRYSRPLLLAVLAMAVLIGVLLVLVWRPAAVPSVPAPAPTTAAPAPASAGVAIADARAPAPAGAGAQAPAALPVPVAELPPSVANLARASAAAAPAAPARPVAVEEPVVNQRELPEPIQRALPPVTVGGYIYSKNPADRLLLIDKVLRHEGEEVAPGLVLEKLQPKEAVFSFRGYRYRVPY